MTHLKGHRAGITHIKFRYMESENQLQKTVGKKKKNGERVDVCVCVCYVCLHVGERESEKKSHLAFFWFFQ